MIIIQTPEEMKQYYDKGTNTYRFVDDNGKREDIEIHCDIKVNSHIYARNIYAKDINAKDVNARYINAKDVNARCINAFDVKVQNIDARYVNVKDIYARNIYAWNIYAMDVNVWNIMANDVEANDVNAWNIDARNILYYAVCIAYETFKCKSVKGRRENSVHMCLDGEIEYKVGNDK